MTQAGAKQHCQFVFNFRIVLVLSCLFLGFYTSIDTFDCLNETTKMVLIHWQVRSCPSRLRYILERKFNNFILTYRTLTFNTHMNMNYGIDILFEPIFWFVDNFAQCLGPFFVFCVSVLTASVVFIAYWVGLPYWLERSPNFTVVLVIFGNWLLWNICFHYYKGVMTSPGHPPEATLIVNAASICRKCISPKPPRTHHCSVCDRCVLNMDHHCPWLNNCVGYFNARHFFLYMVYMVLGVLFVILAGLDIGYVVLWLNDTGGENTDNDPALEGHPVRLNQSGVFVPVTIIHEYDSELLPREHDLPPVVITEAQKIAAHPFKRRAVIYMALLNVAVLLALGSLTIVHGKQIHHAETSVEFHINETEKKIIGKRFRNPYDFGPKKNWKIFLGLTHGRTFFWNVIIPSGHKPAGTGLHFHTINDIEQDWP